jgi:hypothetical protein
VTPPLCRADTDLLRPELCSAIGSSSWFQRTCTGISSFKFTPKRSALQVFILWGTEATKKPAKAGFFVESDVIVSRP